MVAAGPVSKVAPKVGSRCPAPMASAAPPWTTCGFRRRAPMPVAPTGRPWPHGELLTHLAPRAISAELRTGSTAPAAAGACPVVPCSAPDSSSGSMPTICEFSVSFVLGSTTKFRIEVQPLCYTRTVIGLANALSSSAVQLLFCSSIPHN
jgi:hypothetical protein